MASVSEEQKNARRKAMLLLEHMDRTEKGLSDRLRQAGFSAEATEDAMEYVRSYGYLNDLRYAENYISFRMGTKSRQKILQELSRLTTCRNLCAALLVNSKSFTASNATVCSKSRSCIRFFIIHHLHFLFCSGAARL